MENRYLPGLLIQEGFYFIKPLMRKGFLDCLGYVSYEEGVPKLLRAEGKALEVVLESEEDFSYGEKQGLIPVKDLEELRNPESLRSNYQRLVSFIEENL